MQLAHFFQVHVISIFGKIYSSCQDMDIDNSVYDADVFNPLTFIEEAEREINVKDICGSLTECSVNDKIIQMTENEFVMYQSAIINHVDSVTIEEARECAGEVQKESNSTVRKSRRARKRTHYDAFMYYDD